VLLEPFREAFLSLAPPLALQLHPVGGVDPVGGKELLDLLAEPGVGGRLRVEERSPDLLSGDAELAEHLLAHQDRRELPLAGDVEHRAPVLPLEGEPGELPLDDVEPPRRVAGHPMGVDDEQELGVDVLRSGNAVDVLVGD